MADSILRLKVESQEYDNKLKRAAEGIQRYAEQCRAAGGTLEHLDDGVEQFVRELGKMDTTAKGAKGSLSEMTKAFTEMSVQYNKLTDAEKQAPFGKALKGSLDELKGRIQTSKQELNDINKSINGGGGLTGALDTLSDKFGMSLKSLAGWGTALTAAKAALGVMSDAFFASESNVDEWGRVMDSSKSLYEGFLTALNTGDISGYLGRIDQIVQAARVAYNELDRLGTMKTIQAPQISAQQTENERLRMMIQTGRYIAPIDGRKNALFNGKEMQNGQLLTTGQIRFLEKQLQNGMNKVVGLVSNEVKQTTKAIDAVYNRQAQELGISIKEFRKGTSSMAEFDNRIAGAANYLEYERQHTIRDDKTGIGHRDKTANPYEAFKAWSVFRVDGQRYNDLVKLIQQRDQQAASAYGMQSQAYRTMNRADGVTLRQLMGNTGSGGSGKGGTNTEITYAADSIAAMEKEVQELTKLWKEAGAAVRDEYAAQLAEAKLRLDTLMGKNTGIAFDSDFAARQVGIARGENTAQTTGLGSISIAEQINEASKGLQGNALESLQKLIKGGNDAQKSWANAAHAIGSVGSALAGIDSPAAKIMGIVAEAIANIALGFAMATAKDSKLGVFGWIAAIAGGLGTMMSTISAIHSATGFAEGGVVEGNTYSGDQIPAMLNAGEVVLNRAQQGAIASQLSENGGGGGGYVPSSISGEQIYIAVNRYTRRTGKGEIVTWK